MDWKTRIKHFSKSDAVELLDEWWIDHVPLSVPGGTVFMFVPVHGEERGTKALRLIEANGVSLEQLKGLNRQNFGGALKSYENMFWAEAWPIARQYGLTGKVVGTMARDAVARFAPLSRVVTCRSGGRVFSNCGSCASQKHGSR
jgi:hypothetical protein